MATKPIVCPACNNVMQVGPQHEGKHFRCPKCLAAFTVPGGLFLAPPAPHGKSGSGSALGVVAAFSLLVLLTGSVVAYFVFSQFIPAKTNFTANADNDPPVAPAATLPGVTVPDVVRVPDITKPAVTVPAVTVPEVPVWTGKGAPALLHQANLQYVGAFRVPPYYDDTGDFSFGGTALAYNPANKSLFVVGYAKNGGQPIAEISVPNSIVNSKKLGDLATAKLLQPWTNVLSKLQNPMADAADGAPIGGMMVYNGKILGTQYAYYSGANSQKGSHFVIDSCELSTAKVQGLYQVGNQPRMAAGYMTPIPSEWQDPLGAPFLTGQGDIPIVGTVSSGPAAIGFDPKKLGSEPAPATPYLYYPGDKPLGPYTGPANPLQSGTATVNGVVFAPGTSSVLFIGATGTNFEGYGTPDAYGDAVHGGKGSHTLNGEYAFQVWAYDANDFVAVKKGKLKPWEVQPYDVWNFTVPIPGNYTVGGVAFDTASGRVYVSVMNADSELPHSSLPLIEVYQLNEKVAIPTVPHIGTLSVNREDYDHNKYDACPTPGPIPAGTTAMLTAGNVYAVNGAKIKQVKFYLDSLKGKALGSGTQSTVSNASHNWHLTFSTTGIAPGTYTIFAQAEDSGGQFSDPITATVTIS
jgi:hypothetical protein